MEIHYRAFGAYRASILFFLCLLSMNAVVATPTLNPYDTQPIYSPLGLEKYYKKQKKAMTTILLSPFYQFSDSAKDEEGEKVWAGDRLGKTNIFGLLWDAPFTDEENPTPTTKYTNWKKAFDVIKEKTAYSGTSSIYRVPDGKKPLSESTDFDPTTYPFVYVSTPLKYEKTGLRGKLGFESKWGLGVALKGGLANVKQDTQLTKITIPTIDTYLPFRLENQFELDVFSASKNDDAVAIYNALYNTQKLDLVAKDLELTLQSYSKTTMEDTHLQLYCNIPCIIHDKKGDEALSVVPFFAVGFWMPSGNDIDQNNPYSVSTGNEGFWGVSFDANLSFDFPMIPKDNQHIQLAFGLGLVLFPERDINNYRVFTNSYQRNLIPWKANISKEPGITWYGNIAFKADNFIENVNAYIEYVYTQHEKDTLTLRETDKARLAAFQAGIGEQQRISWWQNQQMNFGIAYQVVPQLSFGFSVQAQITGKRVMRAVTTLGTVSFTF